MSPRGYAERSEKALMHMLCIAGFDHKTELKGNKEYFNDVLILLTSVKARLIKHTRLTVEEAAREIFKPNESPDNEEREILSCFDSLQERQLERTKNISESRPSEQEKAKSDIAGQLVANLPKHKYDQVAKLTSRAYGQQNEMQTWYKAHKNLPVINELSCTYKVKDAINLADDDGCLDNDEPIINSEVDTSSITSEQEIVRCDGAYVSLTDCASILLRKITDVVDQVPGGTLVKALDRAFFLACADGAQHERLSEGNNNIITYSITLVSRYLIFSCAVYPSSGKWLLPHLQLRGKENLDTLTTVLNHRFEHDKTIKLIYPVTLHCPIYDFADGKAVYLYTGHTHWASNTKPFVKCLCERGMSADPQHQCLGITDEFYKEKIRFSVERWNNRNEISQARERRRLARYDAAEHRRWCTDHNDGICHFCALPLDYNLSSLWLDVFHGRSGVVKIMLRYCRKIMHNMPYRNVKLFAAMLSSWKSWDGYVVDPWVNDESQAHIKGRHTKEFIKRIPEVVTLLVSLFPRARIEPFCRCLEAFEKMSKIISLFLIDLYDEVKEVLPQDTTITSASSQEEIANAVIERYEELAKELYLYGHESFMTRRIRGDGESFYLHTMRWYIPKMLRKVYDLHKLGIAVFTMEGFEYKNQTSKRMVKTRTNGKGNITKQSMKAMHMLFSGMNHNVKKELQKRHRDE